MGRDRGARPGTSSGPGGKARSGQITGATQLSLLTAKNAGHTGLNWITQAVSSTSTWYAFAGHVTKRRTLPPFGGVFGVEATALTRDVVYPSAPRRSVAKFFRAAFPYRSRFLVPNLRSNARNRDDGKVDATGILW